MRTERTRRQLFITIDRGKMASRSEQSVLLDLCHSRVKKYAESKHTTAFKGETNPEFINAAVLVPIFLKEGSLHILLTLRSQQVSTHKGHVAFPGGKEEDGDKDIVATALREAHEEVGLPPGIVDVIAVLSPVISRARDNAMYVYPVVGIVKSQFDLVINSSEVETAFEVPLEFFLRKATHRQEKMTFKSKTYDIHLFDFETSDNKHQDKSLKFLIWGLTALICLKVAIVALNKLPEFELEEHYSQLMQFITELNTEGCDFKSLSRI